MDENYRNPELENNQDAEKDDNAETRNDGAFESDTQKIIHRHLENKDDIITDEDIASIRIGMTPPDEATAAVFDEEAREKKEKELLNDSEDINKDENLESGQATPWDIIDPAK